MDTDYADDLALLRSTPAQAESLLHSLEQAAGDIGLYMKANKPVCFKLERSISSLSGKPLKLVSKFTYLDNNISSIESDVNICLVKVMTTIDRLLMIWKSDLSNKIKWHFSKL